MDPNTQDLLSGNFDCMEKNCFTKIISSILWFIKANRLMCIRYKVQKELQLFSCQIEKSCMWNWGGGYSSRFQHLDAGNYQKLAIGNGSAKE